MWVVRRKGGGDGFWVCSRGGNGSLVASLNSCLSASRAASASGHVSPYCLQLSPKAPVSPLGFCGVDAAGASFGIAGMSIAGFCPVRGYVPGIVPLSGVHGGGGTGVCAGSVIGVCAAGSSRGTWVAGHSFVSMIAGSSMRLGSGFFESLVRQNDLVYSIGSCNCYDPSCLCPILQFAILVPSN